MNHRTRLIAYGTLLTALLVLAPLAAAQPQTYHRAPAKVDTIRYDQPCDNQAECANAGKVEGVTVSVQVTTNPLCVKVTITIYQKVAVYVYPPGIWVRRTIEKKITNETCVSSSKDFHLLDSAMAYDHATFMNLLTAATFDGFSTGPGAADSSLLRFSALDAEGQEIGHFLVGTL